MLFDINDRLTVDSTNGQKTESTLLIADETISQTKRQKSIASNLSSLWRSLRLLSSGFALFLPLLSLDQIVDFAHVDVRNDVPCACFLPRAEGFLCSRVPSFPRERKKSIS